MERKYSIGDIVFYHKNGLIDRKSKFEVIDVYPLEVGEKYFVLKDLSVHLFPDNHKKRRFYSTDYFMPAFWTVKRFVLTEKLSKYTKITVDPVTDQINLKYNPLQIDEDYYL